MDRALSCDCGYQARASDEDGLIAEVRRHAWEAHRMGLSQDEALLLASRAGLGESASSAIPRETPPQDQEET